MTEWNTNMDEAPECGVVWMTLKAGAVVLGNPVDYPHNAVAWKEAERPEPYQEPCPEQLTRVELSSSRKDLAGYTTEQIISLSEKRTLEIVEWQLKNGSLESYLELKND